jgi:hypothetical protein
MKAQGKANIKVGGETPVSTNLSKVWYTSSRKQKFLVQASVQTWLEWFHGYQAVSIGRFNFASHIRVPVVGTIPSTSPLHIQDTNFPWLN